MSFSFARSRPLIALGVALLTAMLGLTRPAFAGYCNTNGCSLGYSGHINIVNNWWGVNGSGTSGSEYIWTNGQNWGSVFNWSKGNSQYSVKTYPEASDGWTFNYSFNGSPFPYNVGSKNNAYTGVSNCYVYGGTYDTIWDSFFSYSNNPGGANPAHELEVWVTASFPNFGYAYQTTVDGIKYDVNRSTGGAWPIITYVPANGYNSGYSINMLDIARDAANHGYLSYSEWLLDIDFGTEVYYGNSSFNVGSYYAP